MSAAPAATVGEPAATPAMDPRTRLLLEGPIVRTLLRLGAPNMLVMVAQASAGLIETYFVGKLGTDALTGMALVFPLVMLMQMTSAGAMGGGISSAVARALGARRRDDANALVGHALMIGTGFGLAFTLVLHVWGEPRSTRAWAAAVRRSRRRSCIRTGCSPARCWSGCSTRWRR